MAEYDATGALEERYVHGANASADDPLIWYDGGAVGVSSRRHLLRNWQGSIALITDGTGQMLHINAWDAYGVPDAANVGRFSYTGQIWLDELGMYHYKARAYSPYLGRFLQTDPIGYEDQVNLYAYVGNDPVNGVDPTGRCGEDAKGNRIGVCPVGETSEIVLNDAMSDDSSAIAEKDAELIETGQLIEVSVGMNVRGVDAAGTIDEGDGSPLVVLDLAETVLSQNLDAEGNVVDENLNSLGELLEHEVMGEAQAVLDGASPEEGHAAGLEAENALRARRGNPFRRTLSTNDQICDSRGNRCR